MTSPPNMSIRLHGGMTTKECVALAKAAEAAGFAGVWFAENAFGRGILPAAAACAAATRSITINAGVFNPFSRHQTMMAMEIGALDELAVGRVTLSIGAGIASATEKLGMDPSRPVPGLRDTLTIVRALLRGEEADHAGPAFSARKVKLDYKPRADIPIYLAGRGDVTTKLAGELADGLLVSNMVSRGFAARLAGVMRERRRAAGRSGSGLVVQYMPCAVSRDPTSALEEGKRAVAAMLPGFWTLGQKIASAKDALLSSAGIDEQQFASAAARLRAGENASDVLDEKMARAFALIGTPDECLAAASRYAEAGVTDLALTFAGSSAVQHITLIGEALNHA
jgi:5,10-methylenetetrahydromethanopterin reductase